MYDTLDAVLKKRRLDIFLMGGVAGYADFKNNHRL
jgi:hypothetical protein